MAITLPKLESRITVPAGGWSVSAVETPSATATVTVAAGDYYLSSTTSFLSALGTALTANATLKGTYAFALADSTGIVTCTTTGASNVVISNGTGSPLEMLGFDGGVDGLVDSGIWQTQYLWLPNVTRTSQRAPDGDDGVPMDDGTVTVSPSGYSRGLYYNTRYADNLEFIHLTGAKVMLANEATTNESLEKFWTDCLRHRTPFRYHKDRATDGTYVTYRALANTLNVTPEFQGWTGASSLWTWQTDVIKFVG
jgi:hypothetical protein